MHNGYQIFFFKSLPCSRIFEGFTKSRFLHIVQNIVAQESGFQQQNTEVPGFPLACPRQHKPSPYFSENGWVYL